MEKYDECGDSYLSGFAGRICSQKITLNVRMNCKTTLKEIFGKTYIFGDKMTLV